MSTPIRKPTRAQLSKFVPDQQAVLAIEQLFDLVLAGSAGQGLVSNGAYTPSWQSGDYNRIINPDGAINQRALASNADDTYCVDRWYVLTQTGAIAVSVIADPEAGTANCMRLTQSQATAQRVGVCQVIERKNCGDLRSAVLSAIGRVRCSVSQAIRFAVCEWTGTADAVTSDIAASWTSSTYTTAGFFTSTTMVVTAVGAVTPGAATWTDLPTLSGTANAGMNNLFVFIWTEGTAAQNVTLDISRVRLNRGSIPLPYIPNYADELRKCQRYYQKSYNVDVAPGAVTLVGLEKMYIAANTLLASLGIGKVCFGILMRDTPAASVYGYSGTLNTVSRPHDGADLASNSGLTQDMGQTGFVVYNGTVDQTTTQFGVIFHWTASAEL